MIKMTDDQRGPTSEREDIAAHVAKFKATQKKFQREREQYSAAQMERAREDVSLSEFDRPSLGQRPRQ
jgi:chorismate mutase